MRYYDIDAQLTRLRMLEDGWDSHDARAPTTQSIARVERVIRKLLIPRKWIPRRLCAAGAGGTFIYYRGGEHDNSVCHMTFLNDGSREIATMVDGDLVIKKINGYPIEQADDLDDIYHDLYKGLRLIKSDVLKSPNCDLSHHGECNSACGDY